MNQGQPVSTRINTTPAPSAEAWAVAKLRALRSINIVNYVGLLAHIEREVAKAGIPAIINQGQGGVS